MTTEAEAKTKWCPFIGTGIRSSMFFDGDSDMQQCIGSRCMAWRWQYDDTPVDLRDDGHCGLAGKP